MKKLLLLATAAIILSGITANAQTAINDLALGTIHMATASPATASPASHDPENTEMPKMYGKAFANFSTMFGEHKDMVWSQSKEKTIWIRFSDHGMVTRAFYDLNGSWLYTVRSYDETQLDKKVRSQVRSVYYDYQISFVDEITSFAHKQVYVIQLQDDKKILIVRVSDEGMEEVQQLEKK